MFPPVNSGGLIEAYKPMFQLPSCQRAFPPVNSGGLIEAGEIDPPLGVVARAFPPVNSGGLIEAKSMALVRRRTALPVSAGEFRRPH